MGKFPKKPGNTTQHKKPAKEQGECGDKYKQIIAAINRVADEKHADNDESNPKERSKRCREIATIGAILFSACVALIAVFISHKDSSEQIVALSGQLKIMQGQLDAMERDQAPYVSVSDKWETPTFKSDDGKIGRVAWNWRYSNYGKGRAIGLQTSMFMRIDGQPFKRSAGDTGAAFVGDLPIGKEYTATARSELISAADYQKLLSRNFGITLLIEFTYFDGGKEIETAACGSRLVNGSIGIIEPKQCQKYKQAN